MDLQEERVEKLRIQYRPLIVGVVKKALGKETDVDDVILECELGLYTALMRLNYTPPRLFVYRVIRNKIVDYQRKTIHHRKVVEAVGEKAKEFEQVIKNDPIEISTLSESELAVLKLMAQGLDNEEIGKALFISKNTVRSHLKRCYKILGTHNRVKIALLMNSILKEKIDG